jgi:ATP-dependent Clp protease protease subunit|tara:strand:+ start:3707 stop:4369 length:663 start_codon:yes stop_codon:yes gene_type:complete
MIKKIIGKILEKLSKKPVAESAPATENLKPISLSEMLGGSPEPELRVIGLYSDVNDEKIAELTQALLYLNETNKMRDKEKEESKPIQFFINTYGGSADDMFALYDVMETVKEETEIHTIGVGKVMSAGTLLLAGGTKGKRKVGKNCRIMIHNVAAGNFGILPNLANELEAIQQLQDDYITAMVENTKFTRKKLEKLLNQKVNIYLDAEEAVKYGLADEIM